MTIKLAINDERLSTFNRSFLYGDGCFTTIACHSGKPVLLDYHFKRLRSDTQRLNIVIQDWLSIEHAIHDCISNDKQSKIIRVNVTRGQGGRGYATPVDASPEVFINTFAMPPKHGKALSLALAETPLVEHPQLTGIKHNNRLNQILAKQELYKIRLIKPSIDDLLLCNMQGEVIEATSANFFYYKDKQWFTPKLDNEGVNGVTREFVLDNFDVKCASLASADIASIEAAFLTNAVMITQTIVKLNGIHAYDLDTQVSKQLQAQIHQRLERPF